MMQFQHRFVGQIPTTLEPHVLYIDLESGAVVHLCACGCGSEAVTPLGKTDWNITYNGETVTLSPSVGNWSFKCQSHYFINGGQVRWVPKWSKEQIQAGRKNDRLLKAGGRRSTAPEVNAGDNTGVLPKHGWFQSFLERIFG